MSRLSQVLLNLQQPIPVPGQAEIFPEISPTLRIPPRPEAPLLNLSLGWTEWPPMWWMPEPGSPQLEMFLPRLTQPAHL